MSESSRTFAVFAFEEGSNPLGNSDVCLYLWRYLKEIHSETVIEEHGYIDKDYLVDFANYYARSFECVDKFTTRYHFFSFGFNEAEFVNAIEESNVAFIKKLQDGYLGFVVVKPIERIINSVSHKIIGKTLLATYPFDVESGEKRKYLTQTYTASLFGIDLRIESLPFQMQDPAVGACATIACWITQFPLKHLFGTPVFSPYEVTLKSSFFPTDSRTFPSDGLTAHQIKSFYNNTGIETEFVYIRDYVDSPHLIGDMIRGYINLGIPIIVGLDLVITEKQQPEELGCDGSEQPVNGDIEEEVGRHYHAAIISGYRHNNGNITELYLHDDSIGPFCRTKLRGSNSWDDLDNEWLSSRFASDNYTKVEIRQLIVPVYHKIRTSRIQIEGAYERLRSKISIDNNAPTDTKAELLLFENRMFKSYLLSKQVQNKLELLTEPMPRFIWVVRFSSNADSVLDYVFDGTAAYIRQIGIVEYL